MSTFLFNGTYIVSFLGQTGINLFTFVLISTLWDGLYLFITPVLLMSELRHRQVERLVPGHTASKWHSGIGAQAVQGPRASALDRSTLRLLCSDGQMGWGKEGHGGKRLKRCRKSDRERQDTGTQKQKQPQRKRPETGTVKTQ